jgi:gamma-glutamyl-gamma-aminobutyrate hydrolase PuuD
VSRPLIGISAHQLLVTDGDVATVHHVVGASYVKAVRKAGGVPVLLPIVEPDDADGVLDGVDALLMTGGGDVDPASYGADVDPRTSRVDATRDAHDIALVRAAVERELPTLAICRGSQVLNVAFGGTLVQHVDGHFDLENYNSSVHGVEVDGSSTLAKILGSRSADVNTLHHQAVAETGDDARVVARAPDGTIEAVEVNGGRALGVQWHPEMLRHRPEHLAIFRALVDAASR